MDAGCSQRAERGISVSLHRDDWAVLNPIDSIARFAPNAMVSEMNQRGKIRYVDAGTGYQVVLDALNGYFRIAVLNSSNYCMQDGTEQIDVRDERKTHFRIEGFDGW